MLFVNLKLQFVPELFLQSQDRRSNRVFLFLPLLIYEGQHMLITRQSICQKLQNAMNSFLITQEQLLLLLINEMQLMLTIKQEAFPRLLNSLRRCLTIQNIFLLLMIIELRVIYISQLEIISKLWDFLRRLLSIQNLDQQIVIIGVRAKRESVWQVNNSPCIGNLRVNGSSNHN